MSPPGHAGPSPQAPMEGQCGFGRTPSIDPAPVTSVQGNISSFPTRSFLPKRNMSEPAQPSGSEPTPG